MSLDNNMETQVYKNIDRLRQILLQLLNYKETRILLETIRPGIPVDALELILTLGFKKTLYEAHAIINKLKDLGLVYAETGPTISVIKKKRSKKCRNIYCSLDNYNEECCYMEEHPVVVLKPTALLEDLLGYVPERETGVEYQ